MSTIFITNFLRNSENSSDALCYERLNDVAFLDVVEVADGNAAFHAVGYFFGIVFETFQRSDLAFVDLHAVAHQANVGIALNYAIKHRAAGDCAHFRHFESVANFRLSPCPPVLALCAPAGR